jgi:hypothetical protein
VAYGEFKKVGEVSYPYPAEKLNDFRKLHTSEALEIYLCGSANCLTDQSKNQWHIEPYKGQPADQRCIPWSAVLIYVERLQEVKGRVQLTTGTTPKSWDITACCPMGAVFQWGPEIIGYTRPNPNAIDNVFVLLLNKNTISGPGNYTSIGGISSGADAEILFASTNFADQCGNPVSFDGISGSLTLDAYAAGLKGHNKGSFSFKIKGTLDKCVEATWTCDSGAPCGAISSTDIEGTIDGNFEVSLLFNDVPQQNRMREIIKKGKWK